MMFMKRYMKVALSFFLLCGMLLFLQPQAGYACSCVPPKPVQDAVDDAQAVFAGKVLRIEETSPATQFLRDIAENFTDDPAFPERSVVLQVTSTWKGVSQSQVVVKTGMGGGDCGFEFSAGQSYLVYAHGDGNDLHTSVCSRTTELAAASEDLSVLGQGKPPAVQVTENDSSYGWLLGAIIVAAVALLLRRRMVKK